MSADIEPQSIPRKRFFQRHPRIKKTLLVVAAGLALGRVTQSLWLEPVARRAARGAGLDLTWSDLDLTLWRGMFELRGLRVAVLREGEEPAPLLDVDYVACDVDMADLGLGQLRVTRASVGHATLTLQRDDEGHWQFEPLIGASEEVAEATPSEPTTSLALPLALERLDIGSLDVRLTDSLHGVDQTANVSVELRGLGEPDAPGDFALVASAPGLVESVRVDGQLAAGTRALDLDLVAAMVDLKPEAVVRLAAALELEALGGIEAAAREVDGEVRARVAGRLDAAAVTWSVSAKDVRVEADGSRALGLELVSADVTDAGVGRVVLRGLAAKAARNAAGDLEVAGFRMVAGGAAEAAPTATVAAAEPASSTWGFGPVEVEGVNLAWSDHEAGLSAPVELALELRSLRLARMASGGGSADFGLQCAAPGVFELAEVTGAVMLGAVSHVEVVLSVDGVAPVVLGPYLAAAGIESKLRGAHLGAELNVVAETLADGRTRVDADVTELAWEDGEKLLGIDGVLVRDFFVGDGALRVARVEVVRPTANVVRRADGSLEVAGLVFLPSAIGEAGQGSEPALEPAQPSVRGGLPELEVGHFSITGTQLNFRDETVSPALVLLPDRLELDVSALVLGADSAETATLRFDFSQAGLAESLSFEAALTPTTGTPWLGLTLRGKLAGEGLSSELGAAYLKAAGVTGALEGGQLQLGIEAVVALDADGGVEGRFGLTDLALEAGGETWLGLDALDVPLRVSSERVSVGPVTVKGPQLALVRDAEGLLGFAGLSFGPAAEEAAVPALEEPAASAANGPEMAFGGLQIEGGSLSFADAAVPAGALHQLGFAAQVSAIEPGEATAVGLELTAPGLVETARLDAQLTLGSGADETHQATGELRLGGVRGAALSAYLPPGTLVELADGSLGLDFAATFMAAGGGKPAALSLVVDDLYSRDGEQELLIVKRAALGIPRLSDSVVDVAELTVLGVELSVRRDELGALHAAGLVLGAAHEAVLDAPVATEEGTAVAGVAASPARPLLALGHMRLELAKLGFTDEAEGGEPLDVSLVLESREPWSVDLAAEEESPQALHFDLTGAALPAVESLTMGLELDPFRDEPHMEVQLDVDGLSGSGLARALPSLAASLDASAMEGGHLSGQLSADLSVTRRGPLAFDFARGISGELSLSNVAFTRSPDAPVELGFGSLAVELNSASAAGIEIGQLELTDPVGRIDVVPGGLSVAGLVLKSAGPSDGVPLTEEVDATSEPFDITVNEVFASGLDFVFRDTTTEPPVELPLVDLDFSLKGLSTRALREPIPLSFELYVGAGKAKLPERKEAANVFTGILSAAAAAVTGGGDKFKGVEREAFNGLDAAGRVTLFPNPKGWVSLNLAGLELPVFRGAARKGGVDLGDGLLDLDLDVRLLGERGAAVSMRASAAYLSLSEPPGGPISTYLKLPAPLDTVLFLLRNEDGDVVLPLDLAVAPDGGIDGLGTEITKTIGLVIGEAIASSPLRIVGGVLDMTGLTSEKPLVLPEQPPALPFVAASAELALDLKGELAPVFELLRQDPKLKLDLVHTFGAEDLAQLAKRANPSTEVCRALGMRLGTERDLLLAEREREATDLRARFASGDSSGMEAGRAVLLELDGELAAVEAALDQVLALLRPGADRRANRRTKAAALLLAEERLEAVRAAIFAQPIVAIGSRVRVRRARFASPTEAIGRVLVVPH